MMDRKELVRRLLLAPLDLVTLLPLAIGATAGLAAWTIDARSGLWWFASVVLMLASPLVYIQRLALGWGKNAQTIMEQAQCRENQRREQQLDLLARELLEDDDDRDDDLLKDLRVVTRGLAKEIDESSGWVRSMALEIKEVVDPLFNGCVFYLRKSLELYRTADSVKDPTIKQRNLDERETLILEVQKSLRQLGDILANVRAINLKHATNAQSGAAELDGLESLRNELALKLQSAKDVERTVTGAPYPGVDVKKYIDKARETSGNKGG